MSTPAHLATPEAFGTWARENFDNVTRAELRPDGRGIIILHTGAHREPRGWICGYVVSPSDATPDTYEAAPVHGGVTFAEEHDGSTTVGFDFNHARDHEDKTLNEARALREAHNLANFLASESARATIQGRATPPSDAEARAHDHADGWWLLRVQYRGGPIVPHVSRRPTPAVQDGQRIVGRIALDTNGIPCPWPVAPTEEGGDR